MSNTIIHQFSTSSRPSRPSRPSYLRSLSSSIQKDKPRLYIALYPRGGSSSSFTSSLNCDAYHWALLVGPQASARDEPGCTRYHAIHSRDATRFVDRGRGSIGEDVLVFEQDEVASSPTASAILVRITIAKVKDTAKVGEVLRTMKIPEDDLAFSCLGWVREAFRALHEEGTCLKSYLDAEDWYEVEQCARQYCKKKREERRANPALEQSAGANISTFNFWENRETTA